MNKQKRILNKWQKLSISSKFRLSFGILLTMIVLVSIIGYAALTVVRYKTENAILSSTEIRRLILEMKANLEEARRLEREFFLKYPAIGFFDARRIYAYKADMSINEVIALSKSLKHRIDESNVSRTLKESNVNLNFYLFASTRYAATFKEAVELVFRLAGENGLLPQLSKSSEMLKNQLEIPDSYNLIPLYREMQSYEKDYLLTRQRPFMQSAFNVSLSLRKAVEHAFISDEDAKNKTLAYLDAYLAAAESIIKIDVEILRKSREFDLQADAIDPISEEMLTLAHEEVEHARKQIILISRIAGAILVLTALSGLLLASIIARMLNRSITKNVIRLTKTAGELQAGNTSVHARIESDDELGQLARSFNAMALRINVLIENLEQKVLERTNELTMINKQLEEEISERIQAEEYMKAAKEEAEQANRTKSEFLANMSHEIRTPMNAILGFAEILDKQISDKQQRIYLSAIASGGKTLLSLINDILDISKIEAGKLKLEYTVIGLHGIFKEMEQIFSQKLADKNLEFKIEIDPCMPKALILDGIRLRQILLNLVGNSVKFTDSGYIKISANAHYPDEDHSSLRLTISVEDTGIGIPEDEQEAIFDEFVQQKLQSGVQYSGTGLGLSITRRLVKMMGGTISLTSSPQKGSIFTVTIKEVEVAAGLYEPKGDTFEVNIDNVNLEDVTILVVDDIKDNRQLLASYLLPYNTNIIEAENGKEAINFARIYKPDIILMDIKMPVMDGYKAIEYIRDDKTLAHIPIIAVTASAMKDAEERIRNICDGYLRKPVSSTSLIFEITKFIDHKVTGIDNTVSPVLEKSCFPDSNISESLDKLKELLNYIKNDIHKTWQELQETLPMDDIEKFAEQLKAIGYEYSYPPLYEWAEELESQAVLYDVDALPETLKRFAGIIERIEIMIKNY